MSRFVFICLSNQLKDDDTIDNNNTNCFRLITRNTIEESIMSSQKFKIHTARLVLYILNIKGTVDKISNDPSCNDGNARFTTCTLKNFHIKYDWEIHVCLLKLCIFYYCGFLQKWFGHFWLIWNNGDTGCPTKHDSWWIVLNVFFHILYETKWLFAVYFVKQIFCLNMFYFEINFTIT